MLVISHLALAVLLFLSINWVGRHSHSLGYISLSLFVRRDEAPAFNLALRVLGPVVFVTVVSALLYALKLDAYVQNIWKVVLYYVFGRSAFNVLMGRALLMNWVREVALGSACVWVTWLIYENFIKFRKTLLPDFTTATNELWVFIAVFIYVVLNKIDTGVAGSEKRKKRYVRHQYERLNRQFGKIFDERLKDELAHSIGMSVLLYESFNRPAFAQCLERLVFPYGSKTLGPMQVATQIRLSDQKSVEAGADFIAESYAKRLEEVSKKVGEAYDESWRRYKLVSAVAADYNRDDDYVAGVRDLHQLVVQNFYPHLQQRTN